MTPETYANVVKLFGERNVVDLAGLMAVQAGDALILTVFDQHLPPGQKPLLTIAVVCFDFSRNGSDLRRTVDYTV